ncbi:MAG: glycosyltransferase family 39 protein [Terriglobales bacterium]|jgi:hypothetical protein
MNNLIRAAQRQDDAVVTNPAHQCVARKVESSESRLSQLQTHFSSLGILIILWLSAGLIWYCTCRSIQTPRIFGDELNYWDMARGFHQGAKIPYWSVNYDMPTLLYSFVISPVFAFHRLVDAYAAARLVTSFLIAAVVFPAYLLARELLERRYAFAVAILSVALPGMTYSTTLMTENLFYPLFVGAFWSAYRALCLGRLRDSLIAALFFTCAYYTKPHVFVLVMAYMLCAVAWLLQSLWGPTSLEKRKAGEGFALRLVPVLAFSVALVPRIFALPPNERGLGTVLFGGVYQQVLEAHTVLRLQDFLTAWSGLLLSTLVATVFVPFTLFVASAFQLKNMDWRRRFFWLLTALVWFIYTALVARHTVLNDGVIRIHERYIFVVFPQFFVWYFLVREQQSRRFIAAASLVAIAIGAAIMRWPAHVFLTPHLNTDSPSLTGFLCLAWIYHLSFVWLALLVVVLGCAATIVTFSRRVLLQVTAWTLILALVSLGWIEFENRWVNPLHAQWQNLALGISSQVGSQATVGVLLYRRNWLPQFHLDFWMDRPTILYGIDPSQVPAAFNWKSPYVRRLTRNDDGKLDFGTPAPDYLLSNLEFAEPLRLVASFPTAADTLYLYRIPQGSRDK